jgi:hypothetical protein
MNFLNWYHYGSFRSGWICVALKGRAVGNLDGTNVMIWVDDIKSSEVDWIPMLMLR